MRAELEEIIIDYHTCTSNINPLILAFVKEAAVRTLFQARLT